MTRGEEVEDWTSLPGDLSLAGLLYLFPPIFLLFYLLVTVSLFNSTIGWYTAHAGQWYSLGNPDMGEFLIFGAMLTLNALFLFVAITPFTSPVMRRLFHQHKPAILLLAIMFNLIYLSFPLAWGAWLVFSDD